VDSGIEFLSDGPEGGPLLLLAHGAGAPMDSPFMNRVSRGLAERGVWVRRFEFPYMRRRRRDGVRRGPDRAPVLLDTWREAVAAAGRHRPLFIGGKSMGGRIASMVADELEVDGLVCLGYPFHPPGRPERLRAAHLARLATPALIVQGSRDRLGSREEVAGYRLAAGIRLVFLDDGDHSFKPRVRSGLTEEGQLAEAVSSVARFVSEGAAAC